MLKELDVGECPDFRVLELARLLEEEPRERLVIRLLENMEVCGSGDGDNWVGYRPNIMGAACAFHASEGTRV